MYMYVCVHTWLNFWRKLWSRQAPPLTPGTRANVGPYVRGLLSVVTTINRPLMHHWTHRHHEKTSLEGEREQLTNGRLVVVTVDRGS